MMRSFAAFALLTVLAALLVPGSAYSQETDYEFSCSAFPRALSEVALRERYGDGNVVSMSIFGSDDGPQDGTVVLPDDEALRLDIFWWDPETKTQIRSVRTRAAGSQWQSPNGITVGLSLKSIEAINGLPFRIRGFVDEGDPGRVLSWGKGRLNSQTINNCTVMIFLHPQADADVDPLLRKQVARGEFSSGHPAMRALNPVVYQLLVSHDRR